jgi:hypothetical protein
VRLEFEIDDKDRSIKDKEKHINQLLEGNVDNSKKTDELKLANRKNDSLLQQTQAQVSYH